VRLTHRNDRDLILETVAPAHTLADRHPASTSRVERFAPWLAGAVLALPVLAAHYPPMADLPLHEAVVGLLRHWGDPAYVPPDVYELNLGQANQLFYFVILALSYAVGVSTATKLVVAATVLLLPVSLAHTARYLGVTRWTAVTLAPLAMGWMFFWGLLANLIGFTVYFFALPELDRFCQRPTWRAFWATCGWVTLLHFAHDSMAIFAGGTIIVFTIVSWRSWRENLMRLAPAALVIALAVLARELAWRIATTHGTNLPDFAWYSLWHKVWTLPGALYGGYEWQIRNLIFLVCGAPIAMFALERWRNRSHTKRTRREWMFHFRFEIVGAGLLLGYFAAPVNMGPTTLIYHRFIAPAWALFALTAATRVKLVAPWRLPRMLAAFVPFVPILACWPRFVDSDRAYRQLDAVIDHMDTGSTYVVLELGPTNANWLYSPITGMGHVVARLGGRGLFDSTDSLASPVHLRADRAWTHIYERLDMHAYRFMPPFDLTRFRYVILHTTDWSVDAVVSKALEPEARLIFRAGDWTLMESTLPLVPFNAPDSIVPLPHPLTLRKRALATAAELQQAPVDDSVLPPELVPSATP
jgi:hypothetical protein